MNITDALSKLLKQENLSVAEMQQVMHQIMTGAATPAQIGGFLVALRAKGETADEIVGAAKVMRALVTPVHVNIDNLVDTCGTGGDGAHTFNISTAASFVAAAAGAHVAKHGNRSISSTCGSADVLEAAGVNLNIKPEQIARAITQVGVGFMFAVKHHGAMKHAIGPRKELGIRTIFNILGPLTNPAGAPNQVMGVFDAKLGHTLASAMQTLGSSHVLIVSADDGLDELSIAADTQITELHHGRISQYSVKPEQFGMKRAKLNDLRVNSTEEALVLLKKSLGNKGGPASDIVALNAGAAIYASNIARTLEEGVLMAEDAIGSGAALVKFEEFISFTQHCD